MTEWRVKLVRFKVKHGHATRSGRTSTYWVWAAMLRRCHTPTNPSYERYGARGIHVCKRWHRYENFLADMGEKPPHTSLDRIDNDRGYELHNCRWATRIEQARNTSKTLFATLNGERRPVAEWCERLGINRSTIRKRCSRGGWSIERALTTPIREKRHSA